VTTYALIERVLGGFGVGRFYDLTTNPNGNWIVSFIGVVMGGYVSNKWVKGRIDSTTDTKSESITVTKESSSPQGSQSPQQS
jgi:hypothetical protein